MEEYISEYRNYDKKAAFYFKTSDDHCGGIGDYIKFLSFLVNMGMKYGIAVYCIDFGNVTDKFLRLRHSQMHVGFEEISDNMVVFGAADKFTKEEEFHELKPGVFNVIHVASLFNFDAGQVSGGCLFSSGIKLSDIFQFDSKVIENVPSSLKNTKYTSIHIRIGSFAHLDPYYQANGSSFNKDRLDRFLRKVNNSRKVFLCTDDLALKRKLKSEYEDLLVTDFKPVHTGDIHADERGVLNAITDLLILANSEEIFLADDHRVSGFPVCASKFENIRLRKLIDIDDTSSNGEDTVV